MSDREAWVLVLCLAISAMTATIAEIEYHRLRTGMCALWICASCWMVMASAIIN